MILSELPPIITESLPLLIAAVIVVGGLSIYGFGDLRKFSLMRARAIASVSFAESIRRKVLWITPLAMLGVILVSQFQRGDEQDVVRQTIKFSLFASGVVVTITAVILACTNLPKDIDTRVIYTVVTKPTTRLEIIVGKVMGFARVSAAILLLMGVFTFTYAHLRAMTLRRAIAQRLDAGVEPSARPTLEYWRNEGLLSARTFERPVDLQIFAKVPEASDTHRWFYGNLDAEMLVPFSSPAQFLLPNGPQGTLAPMQIALHIGFDRSKFGEKKEPESELPVGIAAPASGPATSLSAPPKAQVRVGLLDANLDPLAEPRLINDGQPVTLEDPTGESLVLVPVARAAIIKILQTEVFYVGVLGMSPGTVFSADVAKVPVSLLIGDKANPRPFPPLPDPSSTQTSYQPTLPTFRSRGSYRGQQLRGGDPDVIPVALYAYRGQDPTPSESPNGPQVAFEMKASIERGGEDNEVEADATRLELLFFNNKLGQMLKPVTIYPESNRTTYFSVPRECVHGGDFDVYIRNLSSGHYVTLMPASLSMVSAEESFDWNLFKSLLILWMLSILVVIIAIFCSTFLSWPIAIMLTLLLLLGHWMVVQLADSLRPGIGNSVATSLFGASGSASSSRVVSSTVEAMSRMLNTLGDVLPDIGQFSAIEDIERGVSISHATMLNPIMVLLTFGLPMIVLSYVILRNKEVAP